MTTPYKKLRHYFLSLSHITFSISSSLLGACTRPFVLSEEDEIIIEQLELGTLLESTLPRIRLVIDFRKFLPRNKSTSQNKNKKRLVWTGSRVTSFSYLPRSEISSRLGRTG
jgi:hypothetical protein